MTYIVTDLKPGRTFAFETRAPTPPFSWRGVQSKWRYDIEPVDGGTRLTESFEVLWYTRLIVRLFFGGLEARLAQLNESEQKTLVRIKAAAEAST